MKKLINKTVKITKECSNGIEKYATTEENVFIYKVQSGYGYLNSIMNNIKDERSNSFGEKAIVIVYNECWNGVFCGPYTTYFSYGIKSKYKIEFEALKFDNGYYAEVK